MGRRIGVPKAPFKKAQLADEAAARAMLAVAWERLGRTDAATNEYARIAALMGSKDMEKWRWLGLNTIDVWSKVQDQQEAAPSTPPNGEGAQPTR